MDACRAFIDALAVAPPLPNVVNPYQGDGADARRHNLALYLQRMRERRPRLLLVGEAPGHRGCGVTGVPFTSEALLLDENSPFGLLGVAAGFRACGADAPQREASATAVWAALAELDALPLLWNAFPFHPHQPGRPASNRTPTAREIEHGRPALMTLLEWFKIERVVAVGNKAAVALARWGVPAAKVRHPGHGGQVAFRQQLAAALGENREL